MKKLASYKILKEHKIILEQYMGGIDWADILAVKKKQVADPDYNCHFNLLIDGRFANIRYDIKGIQDYLQFIPNTIPLKGRRKSAILTKTPKQVANSAIFVEMIKNMPFDIKYFSTIEASIEWLGLEYKYCAILQEYLDNWN